MDCALVGARAGRLGAADLVWAPRRDVAELALVLEPEVPLIQAAHMLPLMTVAIGDSLGALLPPQVAVTWRLPGTILVNGGRIGEVRASVPCATGTSVPDWLVVGAALCLRSDQEAGEPGQRPGETCLAEEGAEELAAAELLGSIAAHFLTWLDTWQTRGGHPLGAAYLFRAEDRGKPVEITLGGRCVMGRLEALDAAGNLVIVGHDGARHSMPWHDFLDIQDKADDA